MEIRKRQTASRCRQWNALTSLKLLIVTTTMIVVCGNATIVLAGHPGCPNGTWIAKSVGFKYAWNGNCCDAIVHTCIKNGVVSIASVELVGECWTTPPGNPVTILGAIANRGFEITVLSYLPEIVPGATLPIPNCPQTTTWKINKTNGSCGTYLEQLEPREINGVLVLVPVKYWFPCSGMECSQTCHACVSQTVDECNQTIPRLYYECESTPSPDPCPPGGCAIPLCEPLPTI